MSEMVAHNVSVLVGVVPLFAVTRVALRESYALPPVGATGTSQYTGKITREVDIEATLIGDERHVIRLGLEAMADLSKALPAVTTLSSGIPLVSGMTTLTDMQVSSLSFTQTSDEKDVFTASISLKHCPRPGVMALVSEGLNAATAIVGLTGLTSATVR